MSEYRSLRSFPVVHTTVSAQLDRTTLVAVWCVLNVDQLTSVTFFALESQTIPHLPPTLLSAGRYMQSAHASDCDATLTLQPEDVAKALSRSPLPSPSQAWLNTWVRVILLLTS